MEAFSKFATPLFGTLLLSQAANALTLRALRCILQGSNDWRVIGIGSFEVQANTTDPMRRTHGTYAQEKRPNATPEGKRLVESSKMVLA